MFYLDQLATHLSNTSLRTWANELPQALKEVLEARHGDSPRWEDALISAPPIESLKANLKEGVILEGKSDHELLHNSLKGLMPWRKGPFTVADIHIDTEWRSDFKWDRFAPHINFEDKTILDVGCGNGYYGYRMVGEGARSVIGIDPNWLFLYQFLLFKRYLPHLPIWQLPIPLESLTPNLEAFDITFSMGVFYHRRSPIDHLYQLKETLKEGGQLVLETLVIEGDEQQVLMPHDRYAQMRNVWYLPSIKALTLWLERVGFKDVICVDQSPTTIEEQRTTEWMTYLSLEDFLDPNDHSKTIEGYLAPLRATLLAKK